MKFNIVKNIDIEKLDEELLKFTITGEQYPYIFINENTARELVTNIIVEGRLHDITIKDKCMLGEYQGNKVFIDNTKAFGEGELR